MRWGYRPRVIISFFAVAGIFLGLFFLSHNPATAQNGAAISQGFNSSEKNLSVGALVSLDRTKDNQVVLANTGRVEELAGVVVEKPLLALSNGQEVQVATSGLVNAIVSDINGDIKAGDKITASPINGVGMKATSSTQIAGIAQADFNITKASERTIKDKTGTEQKVHIGALAVYINISYYAAPEQRKTFVPPFLQELANSVAGRDVSLARLASGSLILLLGFLSIGILLYASIRSSIISIGRNPLSEGAVHKSLLEVGFVSIGILLVMLSAIYLILTV